MDLIEEHNRKYYFFKEITGVAMMVYNKYNQGYWNLLMRLR